MSRNAKHRRHVLAEAERIAAAHGLLLRFDVGGRHPCLIIEGRGKRRLTPLATSPRDADESLRKKLCDVKRLCREICA